MVMKLFCGPCLLNNRKEEIDDIYKTAEQLAAIDKDINFRCKLWGGGTTPEKYIEGIGVNGLTIFDKIQEKTGLKVGTEVMDSSYNFTIDFKWVAARASQNYSLLENLKMDNDEVIGTSTEILIKRGYGMTIDEVIGVHDICEKRHGYKPMMVERGINTFCRQNDRRWLPDFQGMLRLLQDRPDIELCFDVSHSCGDVKSIFPMVRAAVGLGVKNFMFEVMNDPSLSQTDKGQIMNIDEFKQCYNYIKAEVNNES